MRNGHASSIEEARERTGRAFSVVLTACVEHGVPFVLVPYRAMGREQFRVWLRQRLGLRSPASVEWTDGDLKYCERGCASRDAC